MEHELHPQQIMQFTDEILADRIRLNTKSNHQIIIELPEEKATTSVIDIAAIEPRVKTIQQTINQVIGKE